MSDPWSQLVLTEGGRADDCVRRALGTSRREVRLLFEERSVRRNTKRLARGDLVAVGDVLLVRTTGRWFKPEHLDGWTTIHETAQFVVVSKPPGMHCHPLRRGEGGTLLDGVAHAYPDVLLEEEGGREGGLCHRLDYQTSGLVAIARTPKAHEQLRQVWGESSVAKGYLAIVEGKTAAHNALMTPIAHHASQDAKMVIVTPDATFRSSPQQCRTTFRTLSQTGDASLLAVRIEGGVRHQIRLHLSSLGHPIVGDTLYGGQEVLPATFFLHAAYLQMPKSDPLFAPIPDSFRSMLNHFQLALPDAAKEEMWDFLGK